MTTLRTLNFELFDEKYSIIWKKYVSALYEYDIYHDKTEYMNLLIKNIFESLTSDDIFEHVIQENINIYQYYAYFLLEIYERKTNKIDPIGVSILLNYVSINSNDEILKIIEKMEAILQRDDCDVNTLSNTFDFIKIYKNSILQQNTADNIQYEIQNNFSDLLGKRKLSNVDVDMGDNIDMNNITDDDCENDDADNIGSDNDEKPVDNVQIQINNNNLNLDEQRKKERELRANAALARFATQNNTQQ